MAAAGGEPGLQEIPVTPILVSDSENPTWSPADIYLNRRELCRGGRSRRSGAAEAVTKSTSGRTAARASSASFEDSQRAARARATSSVGEEKE